MEIIFSKKEGIPEFFEKMKGKMKSDVSTMHIDVFIDSEEVYFYPKSARVAAFALSKREIERILWGQRDEFHREEILKLTKRLKEIRGY